MKREMAVEEEKERRECEQYPGMSGECDREPYNPDKLGAPTLVEAAEFDIAPGETAFFVRLCREYPCKDRITSENGYNSSNWCAIVRKDGLEPLWTESWVYLHDKMIQEYWPLGAADVDGDGVSEIIIVNSHYGGGDFTLYQYKRGDLKLSFEFAAGDQM